MLELVLENLGRKRWLQRRGILFHGYDLPANHSGGTQSGNLRWQNQADLEPCAG